MSDLPPIEYPFPDMGRWEKGDAPYIHVLDSGVPGPTVMVAALTHGNEVSGAVVVDALLARGLKPRRGTLVFSFNNIEAYHRFDPKHPFKSRMIDEDFNRTWGRLDQPATTLETRRAQVVKPYRRARRLPARPPFHARRLRAADAVRSAASAAWSWPSGSARRSTSCATAAMPPACACATTAPSAIPRAPRRRC